MEEGKRKKGGGKGRETEGEEKLTDSTDITENNGVIAFGVR